MVQKPPVGMLVMEMVVAVVEMVAVVAACMRMAATLVVLVELAVLIVAKLVQSLTDFAAPADECLAITVLIEMCLLSPGLLLEINGSTAQGMLGTGTL